MNELAVTHSGCWGASAAVSSPTEGEEERERERERERGRGREEERKREEREIERGRGMEGEDPKARDPRRPLKEGSEKRGATTVTSLKSHV